MIRSFVAFLGVVSVSAVACSSGGVGSIDPLDGGGDGDGGSRDAAIDAPKNPPGCPSKMPVSASACSVPAGQVCAYGCDSGGPGTAVCTRGVWNVQLSDQQCPPADGPFACGTATCSPTQFCLNPCCGGPAPACEPKPDSGVCPAGTTAGSCFNGTTGCVQDACKPEPPKCVDTATASGCVVQQGTRQLVCQCA